MASDHGDQALPDCGDAIDPTTFEQILEMDDDDDKDFSKGIVFGFFDQADQTFKDMQKQLDDKSLSQLSSLGHFLKGSSATLGLNKVKEACEKIQNYGGKRDAGGEVIEGKEDSWFLEKIKELLPQLQRDYEDAQRRLKKFYNESDA